MSPDFAAANPSRRVASRTPGWKRTRQDQERRYHRMQPYSGPDVRKSSSRLILFTGCPIGVSDTTERLLSLCGHSSRSYEVVDGGPSLLNGCREELASDNYEECAVRELAIIGVYLGRYLGSVTLGKVEYFDRRVV